MTDNDNESVSTEEILHNEAEKEEEELSDIDIIANLLNDLIKATRFSCLHDFMRFVINHGAAIKRVSDDFDSIFFML